MGVIRIGRTRAAFELAPLLGHKVGNSRVTG